MGLKQVGGGVLRVSVKKALIAVIRPFGDRYLYQCPVRKNCLHKYLGCCVVDDARSKSQYSSHLSCLLANPSLMSGSNPALCSQQFIFTSLSRYFFSTGLFPRHAIQLPSWLVSREGKIFQKKFSNLLSCEVLAQLGKNSPSSLCIHAIGFRPWKEWQMNHFSAII